MSLCPLRGDKEQTYQSFRQGMHSSFKHVQINRLCWLKGVFLSVLDKT